MDLEPIPAAAPSPGSSRELDASLVKLSLQRQFLDRMGMAGQVVGVVGVIVWGFLTYVAVDQSGGRLNTTSDWEFRAIQILSPVTVLLFAMLIIVLSSACRVLAGWSSVRLLEDYSDNNGEHEPLDVGDSGSR
jgi:hypothetical protein